MIGPEKRPRELKWEIPDTLVARFVKMIYIVAEKRLQGDFERCLSGLLLQIMD